MIKLSGLTREQTLEIIPEKTLLLGFVGSIAHGTYIPKTDPNCIDDKDILGVSIGSERVYFGLGGTRDEREQKEVKKDEWDSVVYEIRKFFSLLMNQNPNVLGLLWLQEKDYIYISESGKKILENRDIFTSKQAYRAFSGYAHGQLNKMTHFGDAKQAYMGEKRYELVKKFGFDCKNASHLIRLLRMGIEYLTDGQLQVFRKDNDELKSIKRGEWTLEKIVKEADRLFVLAQEAYIRSPLPAMPDKEKIEDLLISILMSHWIL
jgi:predicted nucleotidyltransferase